MGSQNSSTTSALCSQNNLRRSSLHVAQINSVVFKNNDDSSTYDKQRQRPISEVLHLNQTHRSNHQRLKIFSEMAPEDRHLTMVEAPHRESMPIEKIVFDEQEEIQDAKREAERLKCSIQFQKLLLKQSIRPKQLQQKQYELILTIDEKWLHNLKKKRQRDQVDFEKAYQETNLQQSRASLLPSARYKRQGYDGRKIQILFKQQVPMMAKYFYEVQLFSYLPNHKCEFTIGFVEYFKAQNNVHSRDCCIEQSYTHKIKRNLNAGNEGDTEPIRLNKKIRVQISREEGNAFMTVYINGEEVSREPLRAEMVEKTISITPYIQTQYKGIQFGWKVPSNAITL